VADARRSAARPLSRRDSLSRNSNCQLTSSDWRYAATLWRHYSADLRLCSPVRGNAKRHNAQSIALSVKANISGRITISQCDIWLCTTRRNRVDILSNALQVRFLRIANTPTTVSWTQQPDVVTLFRGSYAYGHANVYAIWRPPLPVWAALLRNRLPPRCDSRRWYTDSSQDSWRHSCSVETATLAAGYHLTHSLTHSHSFDTLLSDRCKTKTDNTDFNTHKSRRGCSGTTDSIIMNSKPDE